MKSAIKTLLVDSYDTIISRKTIPAAGLKATGVHHQGCTNAVAGWSVGMAIDDTVCLGEAAEHPVFNGFSRPICSVTNTKEITFDSGTDMLWQALLGESVTHISCDCVNLFSAKDFEDRDVGEVSGMNDNAAITKGFVYLVLEGAIAIMQMAV